MRKSKRIVQARIIAIICLFIIITSILAVIAFGVAYRPAYVELVDSCALKHGVDSSMIMAIMRQESKFCVGATSAKGAVGLMQLMPTTAQWVAERANYGEYDLYSPKDNVEIATIYIKYLYDKYNNFDLAIIAYNAGEGRVDSWLPLISGELKYSIPYEETRDYYRKVMNNYRIYQKL